jgi:NAD(P)-dependent dehydrogenase (short-subunit alcohol dehydrogenase family)
MNLKGQIAIVTAAGQGMGRGIAEKLALEGAFVVVTGRTAEKVQETARIIESKGGKAFAVKADNSKVADIKHMFDECKAHFGTPTFLWLMPLSAPKPPRKVPFLSVVWVFFYRLYLWLLFSSKEHCTLFVIQKFVVYAISLPTILTNRGLSIALFGI